jgi:peptidoglycan/xylan/chitin deacetylase (PgdA/CDA1 family)
MKKLFYFFCFILSFLIPSKKGVLVLMYHSVGENNSKLTVSPSLFRWQMEFLKKYRSVISVEDFLLWREGKKEIPKNAVLITLDDGYQDTYQNAFPILSGQQLPFTLFLTSDLSPLESLGNIPRPTWEQLREMEKSGLMEVGLHGHTHKKVTAIVDDPHALDQEMSQSINLIQKELGARPHVYAYAYGVRHEAIPPYLKALGIRALFGITDGVVGKEDSPDALRRVQVDSTMDSSLFRLRTTPGIFVASRIKKILGR